LLPASEWGLTLLALNDIGPKICLDSPRTNADNANPALLKFQSCRLTDGVERVLGGRVGAHVRNRKMSNDAGDIDNGSRPLRLEEGRYSLHAFDGSEEVGLEHPAALFHRHRGHGIEHAVSGIVDPDIDSPETVSAGTNQVLNLPAILNITGNGRRTIGDSNSVSRFLQPRQISGTQRYASAFSEKDPRQRFTDSHGSASDNDHLIFASHVFRLYSFAG